MRLSDLLRAEVVDSKGEKVGHVHDARFVREGPDQGAFGPAYRLQGLIVGVGSLGSRLGFDRTDMKGPYPLKALFRRLHSDTKFVEWSVIDSIREGRIKVKVRKAELPEVPPLKS